MVAANMGRPEVKHEVLPEMGHRSDMDECSLNVRCERDRRKTFENWPKGQFDPTRLAKLGFYYTQHGDEIQCAFCGIQLSDWHPNCDVALQHRIFSYECDFIQNRECGNVPMSAK